MRRRNPFKLISEDVSTFDTENPIIDSFPRELDVGKKDIASDLIKKAPGPPGLDFLIQNRLNKLKEGKENVNNSNNLSPLPSPPSPPSFFQPPSPHPFPPSPFYSSQHYVQPPQPLQPSPSNFNLLPRPELPSTDYLFGSRVITKEKKEEEKEKLVDESDRHELSNEALCTSKPKKKK